MKLKIQFGKETQFVVPKRKTLRTPTLELSDSRFPFRALAMAGRTKPRDRDAD